MDVYLSKIPPKKILSKKEGVKDQPPETKSSFFSFLKKSVSRTPSQTSIDPDQEASNPLDMEGRSPRNLELEGATSEEFDQADRDAFYESLGPGTSQSPAFRSLAPPLASGQYRPNFNADAVSVPKRQTTSQQQISGTIPDFVDFKTLINHASQFIPTDLIPGASMTAVLRDQLMNIIKIEFNQVLSQNQALIREAQSLFEYKGMDVWIILQKYIQRATMDTEPQKHLIMMVVLLCERRTNFEKYASKMSKEGSDLVTLIKNKYNLVSKLNKSKANELTLARIGHCFPVLVCSYMMQCMSPTVSDVTTQKWSKDYPKCMKTSAFTALIHRDEYMGFTVSHKDSL